MNFVLVGQPTLNFCEIRFWNLTTSQGLICGSWMTLTSTNQSTFYLQGLVDVISGNNYTFRINFVNTATPIGITARTLMFKMEEFVENIS